MSNINCDLENKLMPTLQGHHMEGFYNNFHKADYGSKETKNNIKNGKRKRKNCMLEKSKWKMEFKLKIAIINCNYYLTVNFIIFAF